MDDANFFSSVESGSTNYTTCAIFYNAGADSSSLKVTFGSTVKEIPAYLFATGAEYNYGDGSYVHITSVVIPDSVKSIGNGAFINCYDLKTVTVNGKNTAFADNSFDGCLSSMTFKCYYGSTAVTYASNNGFKVNTIGDVGKTVTAGSGATKATYKVASSTTVAYTKCSTSITSATIPATLKINGKTYKVTSIAAKAFNGCTKLKKVTIGSNVITIGKKAFAGCISLKTVTFKTTKLKKIGAQTFVGDKELKKLTLKSTKLTKKGVKNALKGSYVKTIKTSLKLKKKYKKYFMKAIAV